MNLEHDTYVDDETVLNGDRQNVINALVQQQTLLEGVEKMYSTAEAAQFFGKTNQWLYWGMRNKIFVDVNGNLIEPIRIGKGGRRRFTLPIIRDIALSCYRRGNLKEDGLRAVFRKILIAEYGEDAFEQQEV